jgi:hypothetical protein
LTVTGQWWEWVRLGFGKYRGRSLGTVPLGYLRWVHENLHDLDPHVRLAVAAALRARPAGWQAGGQGPGAGPKEPGGRTPPAGGVARVVVVEAIGKVQRQLAARHHPDRGGSDGVMAGVNLACDALRAELGLATRVDR